MKKIFITALIAAWLLTPFLFGGCSSPEGFAIYLTRDDTPVSMMPVLSHVDLAEKPIISMDDIESYTGDTHVIELTVEAYQRVMELQVPTSGRAFVVCVNKTPIYWGAFWTPMSSQSFDGIIIMVPPFPPGELPVNSILIGLGYPGDGFYQGEDPRSNPEIIASLEQAGKLK